MGFFLQKKIEEIRRQPESVRMRYVMMCVFFSMILIAGIWFLSVEASVFTVVKKDIPSILKNEEGKSNNVPSLNDLFEKAAPLRIDEKTIDGEEFFSQQIQEKNAPIVEEESTK